MSRTFISTDQELRRGESLGSANDKYTAIFQWDNNFVIYHNDDRATWAPQTYDKNPFRILLQSDGNLVMYTKDDKPVWHTGTQVSPFSTRMRLTLTDEGHLILDNNGVTIWSSEKSNGIIL